MIHLTKKKLPGYFLFFIFWMLVGAIYIPAYKAGFYLDFLDTIVLSRTQSFVDFINRDGLTNQSLYQVTQVLLFGLIKVFKTNPLPWFFLFSALHALNGYLIFRFFSRLFLLLKVPHAGFIALSGAVLFLISPVQAEVVIWKASFHYHTGTFMIFTILWWLLHYVETGKNKFLWLSFLLYFISTFTHEIFYLTPAFVCAILLALRLSNTITISVFKKAFFRFFIPLVALWFVHLLTYHFVFHKWISHYEVNLEESFGFENILGRIARYFLHVYAVESLWSNDLKQSAYSFIDGRLGQLCVLLFVGITAVGGLLFHRLKPAFRAPVLLSILCLLSFIIIIPLWYNESTKFSNDRYFYLPSIFQFQVLASVAAFLPSKKIRLFSVFLFCGLMVFVTAVLVMKARNSGKVFHGIIQHYSWQNADTVLLLNLPNNYDGIGIIPANDPGNFVNHVAVFTGKKIQGEVFEVSSYNMQNLWYGAHVIVSDSLHVRVILNQWGSWWWFKSFGATNYSNDFFSVEMTDPGHEYLLTFKRKPENAVLLFQQGEYWKPVDMKHIGGEQW